MYKSSVNWLQLAKPLGFEEELLGSETGVFQIFQHVFVKGH